MPTTATRVRLALWLLFVAAFVLLYWSRAGTWGSEFRDLAASSMLLGYAVYLALGQEPPQEHPRADEAVADAVWLVRLMETFHPHLDVFAGDVLD